MRTSQSAKNEAYALDLDKLQIGDIILESGSSKFSWWIKKGTGSEYSHAMLYVGHSIIHALTDGVYSGNPQRILVNSKSDLKILRLKDRNESRIDAIVANGRTLIGSLYSVPEAITVAIKKNTKLKSNTSAQYCSKLIASVYSDAGISLVNNQDYCSPEDINKSKLLIEVEDCVRKASISDIEFAKSYNPLLANEKSTFAYLNDCRILFQKRDIHIQSETDVAMALIENLDLDSQVCEYMRKSKYFEHYNSDEKNNPHRYDIKLFLKAYENSPVENKEIIIGEFQSVDLIIKRHIQNYWASKSNYVDTKFEYYALYIELYKNILLSSKKWLYTLHQFSEVVEEEEFTQYSFNLLKDIESLID